MDMKIIARIHSDFSEKFGIPRQSGLVEALKADLIFEPEYRSADALRGLEGFSHIWLIWEFSASARDTWSPTVRPPRLGGNARMGVFATRSPFRPNPIGLSCVRLDGIGHTEKFGPVLHVSGADLMDATPILDIKPYLPYADSRPDALSGWTGAARGSLLRVACTPELLERLPADRREALLGVLAHDPRPSYQSDSSRVYGLHFAGYNIRFTVENGTLTVREIAAADEKPER
jgi:tRNA-Thr(GGU) m(6)t(6)A37 methyltransferase TsaA